MEPTRIVSLRTRLFIAYGAVLLAGLAAIAVAIFSTVDIARVASLSVSENHLALQTALERARDGRMAAAQRTITALEERTLQAQSRASKVAVLLGSATAMILLIGVWVSVRIARSITRPLDRMVEAAARFGQGEFGDRVPAAGLLELDALALRFNGMAEALQRLRASDFEQIMQEQHRIESVLESIDDGLLILDGDGCVQRANPVALRQLGLGLTEVVGKPMSDLMPYDGIRTHINTALAAREPATQAGEIEVQGNLAAAPRRLSYSLMPFHDGSKPGLVLLMRDVTEQRAFAHLRAQFVLRASHELRTPVTGIRMAYDLLAKKLSFPAESREAELAATVRQELDRLGRLLNDLLDLSRLYAQSAELKDEAIAAGVLVQDAANRFRAKLAEAGIAFEFDPSEAEALVRVDRERIDRVFDNLLDNATRHTPRGGTIRLSSARLGPEVEFAVADTGDGVPGAIQNRIFEPFSQFGDCTGGAGLGLALCREILTQHRGRIEVQSSAGEGARFAFRLPLAV